MWDDHVCPFSLHALVHEVNFTEGFARFCGLTQLFIARILSVPSLIVHLVLLARGVKR